MTDEVMRELWWDDEKKDKDNGSEVKGRDGEVEGKDGNGESIDIEEDGGGAR